jgi:NADH-quinone oxidoreductase subunit G
MATIHIDGKDYEVDGADNLLHACLSLGLDVPYFCWHPALGSVGACRQCAVKQYRDADDTRGRLVMSCMTTTTDNSYISIEDEEARAFRKSVAEWLMINHPHDCPVCPEGGNCHLQDMTVMTGHSRREYRFTKRTHENQQFGSFIGHEMNRCIACYRCVRYYQDYADGDDLNVFHAHDNVFFGRAEDGHFDSEFAGNLVEVCPTGVFTDKTHNERYNRKWDMQYAPSICQGCAIGCNISPGERYGELRRIENRYNGEVNRYFLCDRGRFGYGFVNRDDRPKQSLLLEANGNWKGMSVDNMLASVADLLRNSRRVIGIGSPRGSLEANHALKVLVGADNFSTGINQAEQALVQQILSTLRSAPAKTLSLHEMENRDAILLLGEDLTQTAPRAALALRQAVKQRKVAEAADKKLEPWRDEAVRNVGQHDLHPLFITSFTRTRLDDAACATYHAVADEQARLGFAIAHLIDSDAPDVKGLNKEQQTLAQDIAKALLAADRPLVLSGTGAASASVIHAATGVALALHKKGKDAALNLMVAEANTLGVSLLGGMTLEDALAAVDAGHADALVIMENDVYRRADAALVDKVLDRIKPIVIDHQMNATSRRAHYLVPAATFAEGDGTLISCEGRAQRFFQVYDPAYYDEAVQIRESWRWLHALKSVVDQKPVDWTQLDHATTDCAHDNPLLKGIVDAAPAASLRIKGLKIARSPHRYSGRTAMRAQINVHEPRSSQDADTALAFSMEGYAGDERPGSMIPFAWAPGWNSPQAWNKLQSEVGGALKTGDPGVRLFEKKEVANTELHYAGNIPAAFVPTTEKLLALPLYHIFGSDELSSLAVPMQERLPTPYASVHPQDAKRLGLVAGEKIGLAGFHWGTLQLVLDEALPEGTLGLPVGLTEQPFWAPNQYATPVRGGN